MSKEPESSRTVARVVEVLELVAGRRVGVGVSYIANELSLPVSSAHVLIRRLLELGYLRQLPSTKLYVAGPRLNRLALKTVSIMDIIGVGRPFIQSLAEQTGEDIYLALIEDGGVAYADRIEGSNSVRLSIALGEPRVLHATAMGKLYLAYLPAGEVDALLAGMDLHQCAPRTITDTDELKADLARIRGRGYALSLNEHIEGITGIGAPVFNESGALVAAVGMAVPIGRYQERQAVLIEETVRTAGEISAQLGYCAAEPGGGAAAS